MQNKKNIVWNGEHNLQPTDIMKDWTDAKKIEKSKLGESAIYYTSKGITYGVPYGQIRRIYKQINGVSAGLSCCKMNFDIHTIIICSDDSRLAEITYKDSREATYVYDYLLDKVEVVVEGKENK